MSRLAQKASDARAGTPTQPSPRPTHAARRAARPSSRLSSLAVNNELVALQQMQGRSIVESDQEMNVNLILAERTYYFDLRVLKGAGPDDGGRGQLVDVPLDQPLIPGREYRVRASSRRKPPSAQPAATVAEGSLRQVGVLVEKELEIWLEVSGDAGARVVPVAPVARFVPPSPHQHVASSWYDDFVFKVREGHGSGTATLELHYIEAGSENIAEVAAALKVRVAASAGSVPPEADEVVYLAANSQAGRTAFLHVHPEGPGHLRFWGFPRDLESGVAAKPVALPAPLADADDATKYLVHLEDALHDIAVQDDANLGGWLGQVLDRYGAGGRVVVLDKTDSQLPWEMFDYRPGEYLGARAVVVRWVQVRSRGRLVPLPLAEESPTPGRMAAYVGQDEQAATRQGVPALDALAAALHASPDALTADLLASDGLSPIALAYLASGAPLVHGDEPAPARPGVRVRFNQAENRLAHRPVFFVNAPFSACVRWQEGQARGLVSAVLGQVGAGYLGTLGPVCRGAARLSERLLRAAAAREGVRPAELLRDLRAEAVDQFHKTQKDANGTESERVEARSWFHCTFSYVYYGDPGLRLVIHGAAAPAGGSGANEGANG